MKFNFLKIAATAALALSSVAAMATTTTVNATGQGWCTNYCNNTDVNNIQNTFAGWTDTYRNWFAFDVGTSTVASASLSIWNDGSNRSNGNTNAVYNLYAPSSISYAGMQNGMSFGSVTTGVANTGTSHYVTIALNSAGVSYINSKLGQKVVFGGVTSAQNVEMFGYTSGTPVAQLTTVSAVPEPESFAMLLAGLGLMGVVARRRKQA